MVRRLLVLWFFLLLVPAISWAAGMIQLPKTGQETCYDDLGEIVPCAGTGQDGEIKSGTPWPSQRFADLQNGTVIDTLSGLMWTLDANLMATRDPNFDQDDSPGDGRVYWPDALMYIDKLNTEAFLGFIDWRIPNIRELESLMDTEMSNPVLPVDHLFENVQNGGYWSGTTSASDTSSAWVVNMDNGTIFYSFKEKRKRSVWAVRLALGMIRGLITFNGDGLKNAAVTLSGDFPITTATQADGSYTLLGLADGTYTVTPSLAGYVFTPENLNVIIDSLPVSGRDFTAACESDVDADTVCDLFDNCPDIPNLDQRDCNGDGMGDLCDPDPYPPEVCDGIDNDCDGMFDEEVTNICGTCGPVPNEFCDGVDNDCNGSIDENLVQPCQTACGQGEEICANGTWINCTAPVPPPEVCDGQDNDCDGTIDEDCTNTDEPKEPGTENPSGMDENGSTGSNPEGSDVSAQATEQPASPLIVVDGGRGGGGGCALRSSRKSGSDLGGLLLLLLLLCNRLKKRNIRT